MVPSIHGAMDGAMHGPLGAHAPTHAPMHTAMHGDMHSSIGEWMGGIHWGNGVRQQLMKTHAMQQAQSRVALLFSFAPCSPGTPWRILQDMNALCKRHHKKRPLQA
eukprot:5932622-Alexandrium_andersonii.AAC.1